MTSQSVKITIELLGHLPAGESAQDQARYLATCLVELVNYSDTIPTEFRATHFESAAEAVQAPK